MPGVFVEGLRKGPCFSSLLVFCFVFVSCYVDHTDFKLVAFFLPPLLKYWKWKPEPLHSAYRNVLTLESVGLAVVGIGKWFL